MLSTDLTTLANVKGWLGLAPSQTTDDALLQGGISRASDLIQAWLSRSLLAQAYTEIRDGDGGTRIRVANDPIVSVSLVQVAGSSLWAGQGTPTTIPPAAFGGSTSGYLYDTKYITLVGFTFPRGQSNVKLGLVGGYQVTGEGYTIPANAPVYTVQQPWRADAGVTYQASGLVLLPVASNPGAGQYAISTANAGNAQYTFSTADAGKTVLLNYSYTPFALEEACNFYVGLRYRERERIGHKSKTLAQEMVTFDLSCFSPPIQQALNAYRKVTPV